MATVFGVILRSPSSGSRHQDPSAATSANTGSAPHHRTAWGVAANVKEGTMTSPLSMPAARSIVISAIWTLQNTKVGTPRYSDNCLSNSKTQYPPLVTCPDANAAWNGARNLLTSGKTGRTICSGRSKIGGPPTAAIALRMIVIQD